MELSNSTQGLFLIRLSRNLFLCWILVICCGCKFQQEAKLGTIGEFNIYKRDLEDQKKINSILGAETDDATTEKQLRDLFTQAAILKKHGFDLSHEAIVREAERIESSSQDLATLMRIKGLFKNRNEDYLRLFVLTTLVKRSIYFDFYLKNKTFHEDTYEKAKQFLSSVNKLNSDFLTAANELGHHVIQIQVPNPPVNEAWQSAVYRKLKPGQVDDQIIDFNETLIVARRPLNGSKFLEAVLFQKRPFTDWLKEESEKISSTF